MYTIMMDGHIIHDPRLGHEHTLSSPVLTEEDGKPAELRFEMRADHHKYNRVFRLKSLVEVYKGSALLFRGRPRDDGRDLMNTKEVICEGELGYLYDSVVRPYEYNGTVVGFFAHLLDGHNAQVGEDRKILAGNVTVTDPNDYIIRSSTQYPRTFEELVEKLPGYLGGHLFLRHEEDGLYLDYLADSPFESLQRIELGKNILDLKQGNSAGELATVLIPLGANIQNEEEGGEDESRLTIESVNEGRDYITDEEAAERYGWIEAVHIWDDVEQASNLLTKGQAKLAELVRGSSEISITAADLSLADSTLDDFRFLEYVKIISEPHDVDMRALITRKVTDMARPENSRITVGTVSKGMTAFVSDSVKRVDKIESDYVLNEQVRGIRSSILDNTSLIQQTANNILTLVSQTYIDRGAYDERIEQLASSITQTANEIDFSFTQLQQIVTDIEGVMNAQFVETEKYIRFENGVVVIGETGSPMSIRISHERQSFMNGGIEVASIEHSVLRIPKAEIDESLTIHPFGFFVEKEGEGEDAEIIGLSFKEVG